LTFDHHTALEEQIFRLVNAGAGSWLDQLMVLLSSRPFGIAIGLILFAAVLLQRRRPRLQLLAAFALTLLLSDFLGFQLLRKPIARMRPCFALPPGTVRVLSKAADVGSLPSLHASNFFAMALLGLATWRALGIALLGVAALVALSRVYVGVHWPSDVVAGMAWGLLSAAVSLETTRRLFRPRGQRDAHGAGPSQGARGRRSALWPGRR
jgi:undecaprenyl-diphosphatase